MGTIAGPAVAVMLTMNSLAAGIAEAAEPSFGPVLDLPLEGKQTGSSQRTMPSDGKLAQGYPRLALMLGIEGRATIACEAEIDGRVDGCRILSEAPSDLGFGPATQRAAASFTRNPATFDDQPIRSSFTIELNWRLPPGTGVGASAADPPLPAITPIPLSLARKITILDGIARPHPRQLAVHGGSTGYRDRRH